MLPISLTGTLIKQEANLSLCPKAERLEDTQDLWFVGNLYLSASVYVHLYIAMMYNGRELN